MFHNKLSLLKTVSLMWSPLRQLIVSVIICQYEQCANILSAVCSYCLQCFLIQSTPSITDILVTGALLLRQCPLLREFYYSESVP